VDVKEEALKSAIGKLVALALVLIGVLLLAAWRLFLYGVWERVEEATPKQGLEVLLGLAGIAVIVLAGALIDAKRKPKTIPVVSEPLEPPKARYFKIYGLFWDNDLNPYCPADETLLIIWHHNQKQAGGYYESLKCPKCKSQFPLRVDRVGLTTLAVMQQIIRQNMADA